MSTQAAGSSSSSRIDNDTINTFMVNGRAVIDWETSGAEHHCLIHPDPKTRHITFEAFLENDMSQRLSFFRLRIPIRHKQLQDITLYIHIPPDHISALDWDLQYDAAEPVRTKLNTNITRLRFSLNKPAQLIVPAQETLQPKRPLTADIIKALESLAVALSVSIYLDHTTISKARLQSLTEVINSGQSRPIPRYCDLHRLYEGIGGKSLLPVDENNVSTDSEAAPSTEVDSPPSYDEIGPGPPMPPRVAGPKRRHGKRNRQSSGTSIDNGSSPPSRPSKKWVAEAVAEESNGIHLLAQKLFAELAQVKEVVARQEDIIESQGKMMESLKGEVARLRDRAKSQQDEVAVLEQRMDKTDVAIVDLDATVTQHGESLAELEDNTASLQEYCDEYSSRRAPELEEIRDEVRAEVMVRLRNALESP